MFVNYFYSKCINLLASNVATHKHKTKQCFIIFLHIDNNASIKFNRFA